MVKVTKRKISAIQLDKRLPPILKEMVKLQTNMAEISRKYDKLKEEVFPLVEAAGDAYETDGIKAQIVRAQTWEVNAVGLLEKFGVKANNLLAVSASKFRKAYESGLFGTQTELKGIAKLVNETPKFRLSKK